MGLFNKQAAEKRGISDILLQIDCKKKELDSRKPFTEGEAARLQEEPEGCW